MIEKRNVTGDKSLEYIKDQLENGMTLSTCISKISLEKGSVFAFVPKEAFEENIYKFKYGSIYPLHNEIFRSSKIVPKRMDIHSIVQNEILKYNDEQSTNCSLFEHHGGPLDFPNISASGMPYTFLDNKEIYFFFDHKNNDAEEMKEAFVISNTYMFLCGLSTINLNDHECFAPFKEITVHSLELFVENLTAFFVKAYGGEGFLMWTKIF